MMVTVAPLLDRVEGRFADFLDTGPTPEELAAIRAAEAIGRPLGAAKFIDRLEAKLGRTLRPGKRGRPARRGHDKTGK